MNVSVCFEDSERCDLEDIPVLRNSLLNKGQCNFQTEFPDEGIFTIINKTFFSFNNLYNLIQQYVIKFVSDLRQVSGFFQVLVSSTNKTDRHAITGSGINYHKPKLKSKPQ
jgi:hypothetical protein